MQLYLMRHGAAEDSNARGDQARALTPQGRDSAAAVLRTATRAGMNPDLILSSPYERARQTAALAGEYHVIQSLVPHGTAEEVWKDIRDYSEFNSILLTSHEPLMGQFAAWLLESPALCIEVKKAALLRIDINNVSARPRSVLRWMLTPSLCQ